MAAAPDRAGVAEELRAYGAARATLDGWLAGAQSLALLRGAVACGVFDAAREPRTPGEIAADVGLDGRRVADLCLALDAHGIFVYEDGRYRHSPDFAHLAAPGAIQALGDLLDGAAVRERALADVAGAGADPAARAAAHLATARSVTFRPASRLTRAFYARVLDSLPELRALGEAGGRYLELGCGVAGGLLTLLGLFPAVTAVGIDLDAGVLAAARREARELGVAGRIVFRHGDARDLRDEAAFDFAFWSQFFFPADSRAATLAVARRALRPGGYLFAPLLPEPPTSPAELHEPAGRVYARNLLVYGGRGIPVQGAAALREEVEAAGFAFARLATAGDLRLLLARRPMA